MLAPQLVFQLFWCYLSIRFVYAQMGLNVHPLNPVVEDGTLLEMWCSVNSTQSNYSSSDLCFKLSVNNNVSLHTACKSPLQRRCVVFFQTGCVDESHHRIINETTVHLVYNVTEQLDRVHVNCISLDGILKSSDQRLDVGKRPAKPVINKFKIINWSLFNFSWQVEKSPKFDTTYTAWYKLDSDEEFKYCTTCKLDWYIKKTTCNVCAKEIDNFNKIRNITLNVTASNQFGGVQYVEVFHGLLKYNQPDRVQITRFNLHNESGNKGLFKTTLLVRRPRLDRPVRYETVVKCDEEISHFITSYPNQTLALPAFSNCSIAVRCQSTINGAGIGHWSDAAERIQPTPQTVPMSPVRTCTNCFESYLEESVANTRNVLVYFQQLSKREARGSIKAYFVRCWTNEHVSPVKESSISARESNVSLRLKKDLAYNVTIEAETDVGRNTSLVAINVCIPKHSQVLLPPLNITAFALNSTSVRVSWSAAKDILNYTVFWCHSLGRLHDRCQSPVQWTEIAGTALDFTVRLGESASDNHIYNKFGVALKNIDGQVSDISWAKCVYSIAHRSSPPNVYIVNSTTSSIILKIIPLPLCVNWKTGFVYGYRISYTPCVEICDSNEVTAVTILTNEAMHTVSGLNSGSTYQFVVKSLTLAGISDANVTVNATTITDTKFSSVHLTLIVTGSIIFSMLIILGFIIRYVYQSCTNFIKLRITLPVKQDHCNMCDDGRSVDNTQYHELTPCRSIAPPKTFIGNKPSILPQIEDFDCESTRWIKSDHCNNNNLSSSDTEICDSLEIDQQYQQYQQYQHYQQSTERTDNIAYAGGIAGGPYWPLACQGKPKSLNFDDCFGSRLYEQQMSDDVT